MYIMSLGTFVSSFISVENCVAPKVSVREYSHDAANRRACTSRKHKQNRPSVSVLRSGKQIDKHKGRRKVIQYIGRHNNVIEKRRMLRHYLGRAPPVAYHDAANSIVFVVINKVDEILKEKRKRLLVLSLSLSLSLSLPPSPARARARRCDVLFVVRLVDDVGRLTARGSRAISNGWADTVTRAFSLVRALNRGFARGRRDVARLKSHIHHSALR